MNWMILWAPVLELIVGGLIYIKFAEKIKEIAFLIVVQIVLYVVLMNGLLLYGYLSK
ncbi:hypothetical protein [Bacillus xiapuensis]|uniref:Uncharacterized protein n=1 Tax=Bacillus xiapuensis TaxID=2014075 RepID=A0ABU6NAI4_9BACI|nr:hypothetical protein [Bacillus xiapuensis]